MKWMGASTFPDDSRAGDGIHRALNVIDEVQNRSIGVTIELALMLALALAASRAGNVDAATPEQLKPWLGCYEIAITKDAMPIDTKMLRFTDSPVEGTGGAYSVVPGKSSEGDEIVASWWPYNKTAIQLNFADEHVVWAARLTSFGKSIVGAGAWTTDNGNSVTSFQVSAVKRRCDP